MAPVILQLSAVTSQKRSRALALMADHPLVFDVGRLIGGPADDRISDLFEAAGIEAAGFLRLEEEKAGKDLRRPKPEEGRDIPSAFHDLRKIEGFLCGRMVGRKPARVLALTLLAMRLMGSTSWRSRSAGRDSARCR
jgi:hypothetical protein